jgi:hypothetical protein
MSFLPLGEAVEPKLQLGQRRLALRSKQGRCLLQVWLKGALQRKPLVGTLLNRHASQPARLFCLEGILTFSQCAQSPHGLLLTIPVVSACRR